MTLADIQDKMPKKNCLFCQTPMDLNLEMNVLLSYEPPGKIIGSTGFPLVSYICLGCGWVALFDAVHMGIPGVPGYGARVR